MVCIYGCFASDFTIDKGRREEGEREREGRKAEKQESKFFRTEIGHFPFFELRESLSGIDPT